MKEITTQQQRVLDCIQVYLNKTGFPPTRADICKELGFKPGTESFANCGLKLIEAEVAQSGNRQALQQIQIVRQEPAYDGWMGELGLSILRACLSK